MSINVVTLADSIAGLSVTGVTIKDLDEIIESVQARQCPVLYPNPDGFMSGLTLERAAMGSGTSSVWDVEYSISYKYLHSPIGASRGLFDVYKDMVTKVAAIIDKILVSDSLTGAVDLTLEEITQFGAVSDPVGNMFHGCEIIFGVLELE